MFENILNLEGVSLLNKEQQKNVLGGMGSICRMTLTFSNGSTETANGYFTGPSGRAISSAAAQECANAMAETGARRCTYDCAYDGFGQ